MARFRAENSPAGFLKLRSHPDEKSARKFEKEPIADPPTEVGSRKTGPRETSSSVIRAETENQDDSRGTTTVDGGDERTGSQGDETTAGGTSQTFGVARKGQSPKEGDLEQATCCHIESGQQTGHWVWFLHAERPLLSEQSLEGTEDV